MRSRPRLILGLGLLLTLVYGPMAADLRAQSRVEVAPSVTSGLVFDDNIFYSSERTPDVIWRVTPGIVITREAALGTFLARYSLDAERYRTQSELTTLFARQDAGIRAVSRPLGNVVFSFDAGLDSTLRPSELNLSTRLATERRRVWRVYAAPDIEARVTPRTKLTARYDFMLDILKARSTATPATLPTTPTTPITPTTPPVPPVTPSPVIDPDDSFDLLPATGLTLFTHEGEFRVLQDITPRDEFRSGYRLQQVRSGSDPFVTVHVATAGYGRRFGPSTRLTFDAGPRFIGPAIDLEAEATLSHTYRQVAWTLAYARTLATTIGLDGIVDVDRILAGVRYTNPGETEVGLTVGYFRSSIESSSSTAAVYQASATVRQKLAGPLSILAGLSWDYQRGRLTSAPTLPTIPTVPTGPALLSPTDDRLQRQVAFVQFVLTPRVRPLPKEEDKVQQGRARPGDRSKR